MTVGACSLKNDPLDHFLICMATKGSLYNHFYRADARHEIMLMYGKEASNLKQELDRQNPNIPKHKPNDRIVESLFPCIF